MGNQVLRGTVGLGQRVDHKSKLFEPINGAQLGVG